MTTRADIEALECQLKEWNTAKSAAMTATSYSIDGITVTRQDLETVIQPNIRRLQRSILQAEAAINGAKAPTMRVANLQDPRM